MISIPAKLVANLGHSSRIPIGEGKQFQVGDAVVAVFRTRSGEVYATQASCSHKQGPLADGLIGDCRIVCPIHAYAFDLSSGRSLGHGCEGLKTYPTTINSNQEIVIEIS